MIVLLTEFTVRLARNAWTQYNELYRAGLCQAGIVSISLCLLLFALLSSPDVFHCLVIWLVWMGRWMQTGCSKLLPEYWKIHPRWSHSTGLKKITNDLISLIWGC